MNGQKKYKQLEVDFPIPEMIQADIEELVNGANNGDSLLDCYQENLRSDINSFAEDLTCEQQEILKDYYCRGGMKRNGQNY